MRTPEEKWGKGQTTKPAYRQAQAELSRQARATLDRLDTTNNAKGKKQRQDQIEEMNNEQDSGWREIDQNNGNPFTIVSFHNGVTRCEPIDKSIERKAIADFKAFKERARRIHADSKTEAEYYARLFPDPIPDTLKG